MTTGDGDAAAIQARLAAAQERVLAAVEGVDPAVLENQPAVGSWSARDIVGHLVDWERESLAAAAHILGGPAPKGQPLGHPQSYNNLRAALWGIEPWEIARADFQQLRRQAAEFVAPLSPEQLDAVGPYPSGKVAPLSGLLEELIRHLQEHAAQLEAWRLRRTGVQEKSRGRR